MPGVERNRRLKTAESAFKVLDDKCRIYQYLFKGSNPLIPHRSHDNPVVNAAVRNRIAHLQSKADSLYKLTIYFVVLLEALAQRILLVF